MFRKLFNPLLRHFESGDEPYLYKPSHRLILVTVGSLFLLLSLVACGVSILASQTGGIFPGLIFFLAGLVCAVVGLLGSDRAVAKLWGSK